MVSKIKDRYAAEPLKGEGKIGVRVSAPVYADTKAQIKIKAKELVGRRDVDRVVVYEIGPKGGIIRIDTLVAPKKKKPTHATTRIATHKAPKKPKSHGGRLITRSGKVIRQRRGMVISW